MCRVCWVLCSRRTRKRLYRVFCLHWCEHDWCPYVACGSKRAWPHTYNTIQAAEQCETHSSAAVSRHHRSGSGMQKAMPRLYLQALYVPFLRHCMLPPRGGGLSLVIIKDPSFLAALFTTQHAMHGAYAAASNSVDNTLQRAVCITNTCTQCAAGHAAGIVSVLRCCISVLFNVPAVVQRP